MAYNNYSSKKYTTSKGHDFSNIEWLYMHFKAVEPEYREMLNIVGFQPGWKVLDVGCGNGEFIEPISHILGMKGKLYAIDLAAENVGYIKNALQNQPLPCQVLTSVGSIFSLPYIDNYFDAIWCSAVTQYLNDEELIDALRECYRVLRPGGVLAIKEFDGTLLYFSPADPTLLWRSAEYMNNDQKQAFFLRPIQMMDILKLLNFTQITQDTVLIERRHPLKEVEKRYLSSFFAAENVNWSKLDLLSEKDRKIWQSIIRESSSDFILNHPNFYWREGHIIAKGYK